MQEFLSSLFENSNTPIISALVLGLMTAISPCPLATNITATAYISRNISDKKKVFWTGIFYTFGRAFSYTSIGLILYLGASKFQIARFFSQYGEKFLGPLLVILGFFMLGIFRLNIFPNFNFNEYLSEKLKNYGVLGSFLIGIIFALAFCPYSGVLFFGLLIPMTITSIKGLFLPVVFAIGTGIPVILFSYLLAYTAGSVGIFFNKITKIEKVMRKIAGGVFIIMGIYYILIFLNLI